MTYTWPDHVIWRCPYMVRCGTNPLTHWCRHIFPGISMATRAIAFNNGINWINWPLQAASTSRYIERCRHTSKTHYSPYKLGDWISSQFGVGKSSARLIGWDVSREHSESFQISRLVLLQRLQPFRTLKCKTKLVVLCISVHSRDLPEPISLAFVFPARRNWYF